MSDVEFRDEAFAGEYARDIQSPFLKILFKLGLAKDEKTANTILVGIAILMLVSSVYILSKRQSEKDTIQRQTAVPEYVIVPTGYIKYE